MPDPDLVFNRMIERDARRIDWTTAACRDADPEAFLPVGDGEYASAQVTAAKAVCARCPLVGQCLNWALAAGIVEGIWGGRTEQERRMLRRATR